MTTVTNIRAVASALPDVMGYVEAFTADRLLGWAWAPATPELRAVIELRLGDSVVASTVADLLRTDLASNGIGDGRHAYDLAIPTEVRNRSAELRVFARCGVSAAIPIGAPPAAEGLSDQVTKLLRGVDMLLNSQRVIHRNLQTALTAAKDPDADPMAAVVVRMSELQAGTEAQISAVERFVVRLDEHLSRLSPAEVKSPVATGRIPTAAVWALGVSGIALVVSIAELVRSFGG
jgi:hypothetical protein